MQISDTMDLYELAERMGDCATLDEARYMRDALNDQHYSDTEQAPEEEWLHMCNTAAREAGLSVAREAA